MPTARSTTVSFSARRPPFSRSIDALFVQLLQQIISGEHRFCAVDRSLLHPADEVVARVARGKFPEFYGFRQHECSPFSAYRCGLNLEPVRSVFGIR